MQFVGELLHRGCRGRVPPRLRPELHHFYGPFPCTPSPNRRYPQTGPLIRLWKQFSKISRPGITIRRFHSSSCVWMQFYQLVQVLADIPSALGTLHCSWHFFVHQDTASRTEPLAADAVAFLCKSEISRLLRLADEP